MFDSIPSLSELLSIDMSTPNGLLKAVLGAFILAFFLAPAATFLFVFIRFIISGLKKILSRGGDDYV